MREDSLAGREPRTRSRMPDRCLDRLQHRLSIFHYCDRRTRRDPCDGSGSSPQRINSMILRLKSLYGGYRRGASKRKLRFITGFMWLKVSKPYQPV